VVAILTCPIRAVIRETSRDRVVRLALDGRVLPFEAGQHVLLGSHGGTDRKPYSIASAPTQVHVTGELEFLVRVDEEESPGPHLGRLAVGRFVDVEGPSGTFVIPSDLGGRPVVLVGGGTGIAPLRAMLWQVLATQPDARPGVLHSARMPEDLAYGAELRALASRGRIRLIETVTRSAARSWPGERGRIDRRQLVRLVDGPDTLCFVCGPDSLVEGVPLLLAGLGVPAGHIRTEQWTDRADDR
jgi:ferredoxin-NADP reductase